MADLTNLLGSIFGLTQIVRGANIQNSGYQYQASLIQQGGQVAATGAELTAAGIRQTANSVQASTTFNLAIDKLNSKRQLESLARQAHRTFGEQLAQAAGSNISITSRTFLELQNEASSEFERELGNMRTDHLNRQQAMRYQSEVQQVSLENQARASEYSAEVQRVLARNRAEIAKAEGRRALGGAFGQVAQSIPTLLSQAFSS